MSVYLNQEYVYVRISIKRRVYKLVQRGKTSLHLNMTVTSCLTRIRTIKSFQIAAFVLRPESIASIRVTIETSAHAPSFVIVATKRRNEIRLCVQLKRSHNCQRKDKEGETFLHQCNFYIYSFKLNNVKNYD